MARVRRTAFWAARLLGVLAISLFSAMHLTPPAWAKAVGDKDRQTDNINEEELTSLIADLGVEEELQRLSGTAATSQNLAQAPQPGDSIELLPLKDLAPPADVLMQAPNLRTQQAPVEGGADLLYGGDGGGDAKWGNPCKHLSKGGPTFSMAGPAPGARALPHAPMAKWGNPCGSPAFSHSRPPVSRYSGSRQSSHSRFRRSSHSSEKKRDDG